MNADLLGDSSWDTALRLVHSRLVPSGNLVRLVRNSWTGSTSAKEFLQGLQLSQLAPEALIEAAQLADPNSSTIDTAISSLGFKGAATVAAICYTCTSLSVQNASERTTSFVLQHMIDTIEIGYHFGVSAELIGPEIGMLLGFSQSVGPALMAASSKSTLADVATAMDRSRSSISYLEQFGCEPYQVASLALQRLGFGQNLASAAVMALGNMSLQRTSNDSTLRAWSAASDWIHALAQGTRAPKRRASLQHFPDHVYTPAPDAPLPLHLEALYTSIDSVRDEHSKWRWHLHPPVSPAAAGNQLPASS